MGANIIVGIFAVIVVGAGIFAWWMENGPERKNDHKEDDKE